MDGRPIVIDGLNLSESRLRLSIGQASIAGRKRENQDFHGSCCPGGALLALKGVMVAVADGIGTSTFGRMAAESAVKALLNDYYDTPEGWTSRTAVTRVIGATNAWLYMQSRNAGVRDTDLGHVCTLTALLFKAGSAHLFHVGDSRAYRVFDRSLEPLTQDHCRESSSGSYLTRAIGAYAHVEIDHRQLSVSVGDQFLLVTDGVHRHLDRQAVTESLAEADLDASARRLLQIAYDRGADDNLTAQFVRVDALPMADAAVLRGESRHLPDPPALSHGDQIDGYRIVRILHAGARSHVHLATAPDGQRIALKTPSVDIRDDPLLTERFAFEEWIARRIASPHVVKSPARDKPRSALYVITEYLEGSTLRQWMSDNPAPTLDAVRPIARQLVSGLRALHRNEMIHQDLRPENVMMDADGTVRIIDLGSVSVAGVEEAVRDTLGPLPGTWQYTAPEFLCGDPVSWRSDQFALGVIIYEMLTGRLPYASDAALVRSRAGQQRLRYRSARTDSHPIPPWVDAALRRAVHPDPLRRYDALSECLADLHRPATTWQAGRHVPLAERHPLRFWQAVSLVLAFVVLLLVVQLSNSA